MADITSKTANELAHKLKNKTGMENQEIREAVQKTRKKYHPLLTSNKTALMVYARKQKGIKLIEKQIPELDIENIVPEIQDLNLKCTVESVDKFTYTKEGEQKKGCDTTLKDQTGRISMMLWGNQVQKVSQELVGEKVEIQHAYSSEYQGETQVNYGEKTKIKKT